MEQAKKAIANTAGMDMNEALRLLRDHARMHNEGLHPTAGRIGGSA
ncbi:hypothetical protein ACFVYC_06835 [Pseudarthrobacter sp. NPDC058329]